MSESYSGSALEAMTQSVAPAREGSEIADLKAAHTIDVYEDDGKVLRWMIRQLESTI